MEKTAPKIVFILFIIFAFYKCNKSCESSNTTRTDSERERDIIRQIEQQPYNIKLNEKVKEHAIRLGYYCYDVTIDDNIIRITIDETGVKNRDNIASLFCEVVEKYGIGIKNIVIRNQKQESISRYSCK